MHWFSFHTCHVIFISLSFRRGWLCFFPFSMRTYSDFFSFENYYYSFFFYLAFLFFVFWKGDGWASGNETEKKEICEKKFHAKPSNCWMNWMKMIIVAQRRWFISSLVAVRFFTVSSIFFFSYCFRFRLLFVTPTFTKKREAVCVMFAFMHSRNYDAFSLRSLLLFLCCLQSAANWHWINLLIMVEEMTVAFSRPT